jgi:hypothetical protein
VFPQQLQRERLIALSERAVSHHVGEHDGGQPAMFGASRRHLRIKPDGAAKETTDQTSGGWELAPTTRGNTGEFRPGTRSAARRCRHTEFRKSL